jgi:hypothetical protein
LRGFIEDKVAIELAERLERGEALLRQMEARGIGGNVVAVGGLPVPPGMESVRFPQFGPPTIEATAGKPNPWQAPDVASAVKAAPAGQKRTRKRFKHDPDPLRPLDPKTDPEGS